MPTFKAGLLATTLAAVALVPAAGVMTIASVEAAHAKGGNGNGQGNGGNGGRSSEARGAQTDAKGDGRPERAGSRGNGGSGGNGKSASARGGSDPISNFIRSLGGQEKREVREEARAKPRAGRPTSTASAPQRSISPGKRPARLSDTHPSDLGNMNGALNANMNAVLAHIRNGNVNGPVGQMAALAVADAAFAGPDRILKHEALAALLDDHDYDSVQDYYDALAAETLADKIPDLDTAIGALGDDVNIKDPLLDWRPSPTELETAETALPELTAAKLEAEADILSYWNKNPDTDPVSVSEEEKALLGDLRAKLDGFGADFDQAMTDAGSRLDEDSSCEGVEGCEAAGEDVAAVE